MSRGPGLNGMYQNSYKLVSQSNRTKLLAQVA